MADTIKTIQNRYSCRSYSSKEIDKDMLVTLLELANQAPSACNKQNRQFLVVTKQKDREFLSKMNKQKHFLEAPVAIIVVSAKEEFPKGEQQYLKTMEHMDMSSWGASSVDYKDNPVFLEEYRRMSQHLFPLSDATAALTTLHLAAFDMGINSCWIGVYDESAIKEYFAIPDSMFISGCAVLGYEKESPKSKVPRKEISDLIKWDAWS